MSKRPSDRQNGSFVVKISLANMRLTNTSHLAPQQQKDNAWAVFEIIEKVHQKLHGFSPLQNCSKMLRASLGRTHRDDGVQEYALMYEFEAHNV